MLRDRWNAQDGFNAALKELVEDRLHRVEKDVIRTDRTQPFYFVDADMHLDKDHGSMANIRRLVESHPHLRALRDVLVTYSLYNVEVGYVQGMSDLAAPLLACMAGSQVTGLSEETVVLSFWLFVHFLHRPSAPLPSRLYLDFHMNQSGMRARLILITYLLRILCPTFYRTLEEMDMMQGDTHSAAGLTSLFWLFRGVLTLFKRECVENKNYENVLRLWEALFAGASMHPWMDVWIATSVVYAYVRPRLLQTHELDSFDDVLAYMNQLHIEPHVVLQTCFWLMQSFEKKLSMVQDLPIRPPAKGPAFSWQPEEKLWIGARPWDDEIQKWSALEQRRRPSVTNLRITMEEALSSLRRS